MKRPLVPIALLYTGGIIVGNWVPAPLFWLLGAGMAVGLGAIVWTKERSILLGLLLVLAGWGNQVYRTALLAPNDLRHLIGENQEQITLEGILIETPYHRLYESDEKIALRTVAFVEAESALLAGTNRQPVVGRVIVSTGGALPTNVFGGQRVEITGYIARPRGAAAEGLFDYRAYLERQGIYYQLRAASAEDWRVVWSPGRRPIADSFCAWARKTLARGLPAEDEPLRLLWAMTLGWKTALSGEVAEPFMRSGTMHVFAISGMHIALIALIFVKLLQLLGVPREICGIIVIPLIWFYTGVTGWQASAIRSTIMSSVVIAGWSLKRPNDLLNSLAASAFLILLWDPQQLFQASFQLSFFVVLSLALFGPVLTTWRDRWLRHDPLLPDELLPEWRRQLTSKFQYGTAGAIASLAAWLGSAPIIAYYFHLFTPGSLLANLLVVPLSSLALTCNMASLVVGSWFPACAELFNHSAWFWMSLMIRISDWFAWLRGSCYYIETPGLLSFLLYYVLVFSIIAGWLIKPRTRMWAWSALGILAVAWVAQWEARRAATTLTILPLSRGGEAIYLDAPGQQSDCLIDCGQEEAVRWTTQPYLRARGVNALRRLVLTHGHAAQVGGADLIRTDFSVREVSLSPVRFRSKTYRDLRTAFEKAPGLTKLIQADDQIGAWTVPYPEGTNRFPRADDNAVVLRGEFAGTKVLLLSDLGKAGQNALCARQRDLQADIVIAGLPDSEEPLADGLLDLIRPSFIIITDGEYPSSARASKALQERMIRRNTPILYTRDTGSITIRFNKGGWQLQTMSGMKIYWS